MTELSLRLPRVASAPLLYPLAIFVSAALVFLVQPMIARMILPLLGGSPAVWNASMVFFQAALLLGYAYAHALQKVRSVRTQALIHLAVLAAAAAFLPLEVTQRLGSPPSEAPAMWLLGVLALSVGAPFAVLSATAPLLQAWYAHGRRGEERSNPYVLYAASNLGSLLALLAYPVAVEPGLALDDQGLAWSAGYVVFALLALTVALGVGGERREAAGTVAGGGSWRERLTWIGLAALPSSLLLGATNHISTDVASAPFLWVLPLALYLLTFVVAFQDKPWIGRERTLFWQAGLAVAVLATMFTDTGGAKGTLALNVGVFFFTALMCHQALAARRPHPDRLTEFYLCLSIGGVVGGALTAFVAPVLLDFVWEYPAALVLAGLLHPWGAGRLNGRERVLAGVGIVGLLVAAALAWAGVERGAQGIQPDVKLALAFAAFSAFFLRERALVFTALLAGLLLVNAWVASARVVESARGFFGVHRVAVHETAGRGAVRLLYHGTTVHGAQATDPARRCIPLAYYAPQAPIGQTFAFTHARKPAARVGAAGLGAGAVAAYTRAGDTLRFFEIDPLVVRLARDPSHFTFLSECAGGDVDVVLGDARITLAGDAGGYDHLLMDAFSSDSVPTHLLTVEAMRLYLSKMAPDGLLVLHVSNRNLELAGPAAAALRQAGAHVLLQSFKPAPGVQALDTAPSKVLVAARSPEVLAPLRRDARWTVPADDGRRAWSDDYINVVGALLAGAKE